MKTSTKLLATTLLSGIALVSVATAQAALVTGDVGDYVELYANGPQGSETRLGASSSSLFRDLNLGREERRDVGRLNPTPLLPACTPAHAQAAGVSAQKPFWIGSTR